MIKTLLIQALLRQLLDPATRTRLLNLVIAMMDSGMTGEEKRDYVLREMSQAGTSVADWVLNLALELAVARIKNS